MSATSLKDIQTSNLTTETNLLPVRYSRQIFLSPIDSSSFEGKTISQEDMKLKATLAENFTDYIKIRIPHRGLNESGNQDASIAAVYSFLINPKTVSVSKNTVDAQSYTRAGWQFGVWGEDFTEISIEGKTAGRYFSGGLTDYFSEYTYSYRNLMQLIMVHDNNGYWFEGENPKLAGQASLPNTRRIIKAHQDIEFIVGDFHWWGAFETLKISQVADTPFFASFSLTFISWKERYNSNSPYCLGIKNDVQRAHSYDSYFSRNTPEPSYSYSIVMAQPSNQPPPAQTNTPPAKAAASTISSLEDSDPINYDTTSMYPALSNNLDYFS